MGTNDGLSYNAASSWLSYSANSIDCVALLMQVSDWVKSCHLSENSCHFVNYLKTEWVSQFFRKIGPKGEHSSPSKNAKLNPKNIFIHMRNIDLFYLEKYNLPFNVSVSVALLKGHT